MRGNPVEVLKKLGECLDRLAKDTEALPSMIQEKFAEVTNQVMALSQHFKSTSHELRTALTQTEVRLKPPDLEELQRLLAVTQRSSVAPTSNNISAQDWSEDVIRLATEQKKPRPVPETYAAPDIRPTSWQIPWLDPGAVPRWPQAIAG